MIGLWLSAGKVPTTATLSSAIASEGGDALWALHLPTGEAICTSRGITAHPGFEMMVQQVPEYLSFFGFDQLAKAVQSDPSEVRALFEAP